MKGSMLILAALVLAAVVVPGRFHVGAAPQTQRDPYSMLPRAQGNQAELEILRADLLAFYGDVAEVYATFPNAAPVNALQRVDDAQKLVEQLSPEHLALLEEALSRAGEWRRIPEILHSALAYAEQYGIEPQQRGESRAEPPDCGPGLPNGIVDLYIAKDVAMALQIVVDFVPNDLVIVVLGSGGTTWAHPAKIVLSIAVEASRVAVLVLEQIDAIYSECQGNAHQELLRTMDDTLNELYDKVEGTVIRQMESCLMEQKMLMSMCLPAEYGGHLEEVFVLVQNAILNSEAAGIPGTVEARQLFQQAKYLAEKGFFKPAYSHLCMAYNELACP